MARRDQSRSQRARAEWRQSGTTRLRGFARRMRTSPTDAERRLWALVRDRRLEPYKFRRQVPIGSYIVDLLCAEKNLIVELDGSQHLESQRDVVRDAWFLEQGYRTLRFWNGDVLARPMAVLETILAHLEYVEPTPHPAAARPPSPSWGEGKGGAS
jgi:very-short-patch-repair endonuclease